MKRSKSSELRDRLSELPDTLILGILSLLPMSDVVRTTVLSKRWKGLWTSVPCLFFDAKKTNSSGTFCKFVNRAMLHWDGTKLQKFGVNFLFNSSSFSSDVDTWLHFAIKKGVEELSMDLKRDLTSDVYSPPQSLYSCSTIRKASLLHCVLNIKGSVQWDQLKSLRIELRRLSEDVIEKVMLGAPQMEILILSFEHCDVRINMHSNSLKTLKIERKEYPANGLSEMLDRVVSLGFSSVSILTPNVQTLEISGIYLKGNVSSLTRAKVGFTDSYYDPIGMYELIKESSENFFQNIHHLEKVTLSGWSVEMLREIKKENKEMVAPLSNVKLLKLYATHVDDVVDILELFPALRILILLQEPETYKGPQFFEIACFSTTTCISEFDAERSLEPNSDLLMPYLRTVEITWAVHDNSIFPFIEMLPRNVRKLEKMVLRVTATESAVPAVSWLLASQKMLSVQKAFPTADVIMCQD